MTSIFFLLHLDAEQFDIPSLVCTGYHRMLAFKEYNVFVC